MKKTVFQVPRPPVCIANNAHWDIFGKCFFCGLETVIEHRDIVKVKAETKGAA